MNDDDRKEKDSNAPRSEGRRGHHRGVAEKPKDFKKVAKNMLIYMKKYMGVSDKLAFISPCIAKKNEIDDSKYEYRFII